jgi:hypothetical protein
MSVYVDPLIDNGWSLGPNCHLWADTIEELHQFAEYIGLRREWFQPPKGRGRIQLPHYDLTRHLRQVAVNRGAIELDRRQARDCWVGLGFVRAEAVERGER